MKKKIIPAVLAALLLVAVSVGGWFYYRQLVSHSRLEEIKKADEYQYHYVMITDNPESDFWQKVYEQARKEAKEKNAYVECAGNGLGESYTKEDYMAIAIAEKADGIIVQGGSQKKLGELIEEASANRIPVVTVMDDVEHSPRQSFVGVNGYQLGRQYGQVVCENLPADARKVLVLQNGDSKDVGKNLVFSQIKAMVHEHTSQTGEVEVEASFMDNRSPFDAEEHIRKIFLESQLPDVLVCLDGVDTECAYRALVEFNQVGKVVLIGYNPADSILEAVEKGIITTAFETDASQLGTLSVQALDEYREMGHVSEYFSVNLNKITSQNASQYMKKKSRGTQ